MCSPTHIPNSLVYCLILQLAGSPLGMLADFQTVPSAAPPGAALQVSGHVPPGSAGVRLLWQQGNQARGYLEGPVAADGAFALTIAVPTTALPGAALLHALPTETLVGPIDVAPFQVLPQPTGTATGTVNVPKPGSVPPSQPPPDGTKVCLKDAFGQIVACTNTGPGGVWTMNVPPGSYTVAVEVTGVTQPPVTVEPDKTNSVPVIPLAGTTEATCDPKFFLHDFQAASVSKDALLGQPEVALGRKDDTPFARFVSFGGNPQAPKVFVKFAVALEATCNMKVGKVVFTLRDAGGNVLFSKDTEAEKAAQDTDKRAAELDVSLLPAGTHTMTVQVFPGNPAFAPLTDSWSYPVEVVDLSPRWFSGNAHKAPGENFIEVAALPDEHALGYSLHALVPKGAIELGVDKIALGPLVLENDALIGVKLNESYDSEGHYQGDAYGGVKLALLKLTAFNQTVDSLVDVDHTYTFSGPKAAGGAGFFATGYEMPETSLGTSIEEVRIYGAGKKKCIKFCLFGCKKCVGFKIGLFAKIQGGADLGMKVTPELGVRVLVAPCVKASLPLIFQLDAIICSAGAKAEAAASARFPLRFDFSNDLGFHFDKRRIHLQTTLKYYARCFGITFFRGTKSLANYEFGDPPDGDSCSDDFGSLSSALGGSKGRVGRTDDPPLTPDEEAGPVKPDEIPPLLQPAISVNGACQNLTVWIGGPQEGADADGRLRFSFTDANGSSVPANVDPAGAMAESPSVAWLDKTHALAVWVQSSAPLNDLAFEVEPSMPATLELAYAIWDVTTSSWSAPQFLTNDDRWDLRPVLTSNPQTGEALVVWLRQHAVSPGAPEPIEPRGLYFSLFQAGSWSAPAPLLDTTADFFHQPTVRYDRAGVAHAVVVGDLDGSSETASDRYFKLLELGPTGWTITDDVPAPSGSFNPSLDYDTANAPVVAYLVPPLDTAGQPTGGDGNGSTLGLAQKFAGTWRNVGDTAVAGERPTLRIDPGNQAIVLLRRFGHGEVGGVHDSGDRGLTLADLGAPSLKLISSYATGDGQLHWEPAFDMDPATGCTVFGESTGGPAGSLVSVQHGVIPRGPNLSVVPGSFQATDLHPAVGEVINVSFLLTNLGLDPAVGGFTIKLYDGLPDPQKTPFYAENFTRVFPPGFVVNVSHDYTNQVVGKHLITAVVDEENQITETDETNNSGTLVLGEVPPVCQLTSRPTDDGRGIQLDWEPPAFTTDTAPVFYLQRRTLPAGPWEIVGFGTQPSFIDPLAKPGISYEYRVGVMDGAGVFSAFCATTTTRLDGRPVTPERPILTVRFDGGRSAILAWPRAAPDYRVESTDDLGRTPVLWLPTGLTPAAVGDNFQVSIPVTENQQVFRLNNPNLPTAATAQRFRDELDFGGR